jgi:hypothetical protein
MTEITAQRHTYKLYLISFSMGLFCVAFGLSSLFFSYDLYQNKDAIFRSIIALILGILMLFMGFYSAIKNISNAPRIYIDKEKITFNEKVFLWEDIEKIEDSVTNVMFLFSNYSHR